MIGDLVLAGGAIIILALLVISSQLGRIAKHTKETAELLRQRG